MTEVPPTRRRFGRTFLRLVVWGALLCVAVLAILYFRENYLGARAWQAALAETQAAGETLDPSLRRPLPADDVENFFAHPTWSVIAKHDRMRFTPGMGDPTAMQRLEQLRLPRSDIAWREGAYFDFAAWSELMKFSNGQAPASNARAALAPLDADFAALREAAARPRAVFPLAYDRGDSGAAHTLALRNFCRAVQFRALTSLALGETEAAHRDTMLALQLADALREEPLVISQVVRALNLETAIPPLWEGLAKREWTEAQLAEFEAMLARIDLVKDWPMACRGDRDLFVLRQLDAMRQDRGLVFALTGTNRSSSHSYVGWTIPFGWIDFNKASIVREYHAMIPLAKPDAHRFFASQARSVAKRSDREFGHGPRPRTFLASMFSLSIARSLEILASAQVTLDQARVAIGLERHRLQHGAWPESLGALGPMPIDAMSGEPFHYRRDAERGTFLLYSLGWNERDDQGTTVWRENPRLPLRQEGDWVWPAYPATTAR